MKVLKASDEVVEFVDKIIESTGLKGYISFDILNNESQKALVTATKGSSTSEYYAKASPLVIIYVNENIWFRIDDERMREILVRDAIDGVSYDTEKEKLIVEKPQINISLGAYRKYGESLLKAAETVILAAQQIEEEKKEARNAKQKGKK